MVYDINLFMNEYERIRFLTANYFSLQGLRFTPLWLFLVLRPWGGVLPDHRPIYVRDYVTLAMLLVCGLWIWLAGRYYRNRYGRVQSSPQPWSCSFFIVGVVVTYFAFFLADETNPPVSFVAVWWGCWLGAQALWTPSGIGARRICYGIAAICLLALALLPLTGWIASSQLLTAYHPSGAILLGIIMLTLGVLDHMLLVRLISQPMRSVNA